MAKTFTDERVQAFFSYSTNIHKSKCKKYMGTLQILTSNNFVNTGPI